MPLPQEEGEAGEGSAKKLLSEEKWTTKLLEALSVAISEKAVRA